MAPKSQKNPQYAPNGDAAERGTVHESDAKTRAVSPAPAGDAKPGMKSPAQDGTAKSHAPGSGEQWQFSTRILYADAHRPRCQRPVVLQPHVQSNECFGASISKAWITQFSLADSGQTFKSTLLVWPQTILILKDPLVIKNFVNCLQNDWDSDVPTAAIDALRKLTSQPQVRTIIGTTDTIGAILNVLSSKSCESRRAIINLPGELGELAEIRDCIGRMKGIDKIVDCLIDDADDVQKAAAGTLAKPPVHAEIRRIMGISHTIGKIWSTIGTINIAFTRLYPLISSKYLTPLLGSGSEMEESQQL
ncbi:hypothetical protein C8R45DRAFT_1131986 [Mycena sanguinolenta]|nr:hypothetical protein C8R45DRAFT_1131986 [Mycena sanguinolenta]